MGIHISQLPLPELYEPLKADKWDYEPYVREIQTIAKRWSLERSMADASDYAGTMVLGIDIQNDFCHPKGALYVAGHEHDSALDATKATLAFLYRATPIIEHIELSRDTHIPISIHLPRGISRKDGSPAAPFSTITVDAVLSGEYRISDALMRFWGFDAASAKAYLLHYTRELLRKNKPALTVWPEHCISGTRGQQIVGAITEAVLFHGACRNTKPLVFDKGLYPEISEAYSIFGPEVTTNADGTNIVDARKDFDRIRRLLSGSRLFICGQADYYCVRSSIDDIVDYALAVDASLLRKVTILTDCISSVVVRDANGAVLADSGPLAQVAFERYRSLGVTLEKSTDVVFD